MTKLITILIILVVGFIGYHLFEYWRSVEQDDGSKKAAVAVSEDQLPGMPWQLQQSLEKAKDRGAAGLRDWLKAYGAQIQDPRKAAIQLDYCMMVARDDVSEAKRVFAEVKQRTPKTSPLWPRIEQMSKTYD